jgi:hypothetical protein
MIFLELVGFFQQFREYVYCGRKGSKGQRHKGTKWKIDVMMPGLAMYSMSWPWESKVSISPKLAFPTISDALFRLEATVSEIFS